MSNLQDLKDDALAELQDWIDNEGLSKSAVDDIILEIADSTTPIYYADIVEYTHDVGHYTPELAEGCDVYKTIQIAIYEEITNHLYDWLRDADECEICECVLTTANDEHPDGLCQVCAVEGAEL